MNLKYFALTFSLLAAGQLQARTYFKAPTKSDKFGHVGPNSQSAMKYDLRGRLIPIHDYVLDTLVPLNGQKPPQFDQYVRGQITVGNEIKKHKVGNKVKSYYEIMIKDASGRSLPGSYLISKGVLDSLSTKNASIDSNQLINTVQGFKTPPLNHCKNSLSFFTDPHEDENRNKAYKERVDRQESLLPEGRFKHGTAENPESTEERYQEGESLPIAIGESKTVSGFAGLINVKDNDPNANNGTPGCEALRASEEEQKSNPKSALSFENMKTCIGNIQDRMMNGLGNPVPQSKQREFFRRLLQLPNQEQEYAALVFTLKGEISGHIKQNPMEGFAVIKVLENRRNNANNVEAALAECKRNFSVNSDDYNSCYSQANKEAPYNLLDIALDKRQFSMYNGSVNGGGEGNWQKFVGTKRPGQYDEVIKNILNYQNLKDVKFSGPNSDLVSRANFDKLYHYHTPAARPDWRRDNQMLDITGYLEDGTEIQATSAHKFYYQLAEGGKDSGDGWRKSVRNLFRE